MRDRTVTLIEKLGLLPETLDELEAGNAELAIDEDEADDGVYRAFVISRQGYRPAVMLDLVFRDGNRDSFAYSHLYRVRFNPSQGIELLFTDHVVTIRGRLLAEGHRRLQSQRVVRITEADLPTAKLIDGQPVVTEIVVAERKVAVTAPDPSETSMRK